MIVVGPEQHGRQARGVQKYSRTISLTGVEVPSRRGLGSRRSATEHDVKTLLEVVVEDHVGEQIE